MNKTDLPEISASASETSAQDIISRLEQIPEEERGTVTYLSLRDYSFSAEETRRLAVLLPRFFNLTWVDFWKNHFAGTEFSGLVDALSFLPRLVTLSLGGHQFDSEEHIAQEVERCLTSGTSFPLFTNLVWTNLQGFKTAPELDELCKENNEAATSLIVKLQERRPEELQRRRPLAPDDALRVIIRWASMLYMAIQDKDFDGVAKGIRPFLDSESEQQKAFDQLVAHYPYGASSKPLAPAAGSPGP